MTAVLPSYVRGRWETPDAEGRPIADAVTGEEVGRLPTDGVDVTNQTGASVARYDVLALVARNGRADG